MAWKATDLALWVEFVDKCVKNGPHSQLFWGPCSAESHPLVMCRLYHREHSIDLLIRWEMLAIFHVAYFSYLPLIQHALLTWVMSEALSLCVSELLHRLVVICSVRQLENWDYLCWLSHTSGDTTCGILCHSAPKTGKLPIYRSKSRRRSDLVWSLLSWFKFSDIIHRLHSFKRNTRLSYCCMMHTYVMQKRKPLSAKNKINQSIKQTSVKLPF